MARNKEKISRYKYISLQEASKLCSYSQDYLSLRARQGKLKAIKKGRNWTTTRQWLNQYVSSAQRTHQYISLQTAAKVCPYSPEYLALRARQGKIKAVKLRDKWVTTPKWLNDYLRQIKIKGKREKGIPQGEIKEIIKKPFWPDFVRNLPGKINQTSLRKIVSQFLDKGLVFINAFGNGAKAILFWAPCCLKKIIQHPKFTPSLILVLLSFLLLNSIFLVSSPVRQGVFETGQQLGEIKSFFQESFNQTSANLLEKLSQFNQKIIQAPRTIKSKLGQAYIKLAEFLVPGYSLERMSGQEPDLIGQRRKVTQVIEMTEPLIQKIAKQVQQAIPEIVTKEITQIKETVKETAKVTEITRLTETIQSADLALLNQEMEALDQRITTLGSQISSKIDYTVPSYAPTYVPSTGLQVSGHALLSTLNVSGSAAVGGSLAVQDNVSFGNSRDTNTLFDVYSTATFHEAVDFNKGISSDSGLTIAGDGSINGGLTVGGDVNISSSAASYKIQGSDITSGSVTIIIAASDSTNKNRANYVCDGTSDEVEIQQAIDSLTNGGTIRLLEGTFTFSDSAGIVFDEDNDNIWIEGSGQEITTLTGADDSYTSYFGFNVATSTTLSNVQLSNFTIDGTNQSNTPTLGWNALIEDFSAGNLEYITIDNLRIKANGVRNSPISFYNDSGLNQYIRISNLYVSSTGYAQYGIHVRKPTKHLWIENNYVELNSSHVGYDTYNSIAVYGGTEYFYVNNNTVEHTGDGHATIAVSPASYGEIIGNIVEAVSNDEGGIEVEQREGHGGATTTPSHVIVSNNIVRDGYWGIYTRFGSVGTVAPYEVIIANNIISNCVVGINIIKGTDITVYGNTYKDNTTNFSKGASATVKALRAETGVYSAENVGIGTTTPYSRLSVWGDGTNPIFEAVDNASSTMFTILNNGNVGIGTMSPEATLNLSQDSAIPELRLTRTGSFATDDSVGDLVWAYGNDSLASIKTLRDSDDDAGSLVFSTQETGQGVTEKMRITSDGDVGIGYSIPMANLHVSEDTDTARIIIERRQIVADEHVDGALTFKGFDTESHAEAFSEIQGINIDDTSGSEKGALTFRTNNAGVMYERIRIDNDGYVGIGTSSPDVLLHLESTSANGQLDVGYDWDSYANFKVDTNGDLTIDLNTTNATTTFQDNVQIVGNLDGASPLNIVTDTQIHGSATTTGSYYIGQDLTVLSGNVGIGTTEPGAKLEVKSTAGSAAEGQEVLRLNGAVAWVTPGSGPKLSFYTYSTGQEMASIQGYTFGDSETGLGFATKLGTPTTKMVITASGNVGIGTTEPGAKLAIKGGINDQTLFKFLRPVDNDNYPVNMFFGVDGTYHKAGIGFVRNAGVTNGIGRLDFLVDSNDDAADVSCLDTKMSITSTGNVGIGTTSPYTALDVQTDVANYAASISNLNSAAGNGLRVGSRDSGNNDVTIFELFKGNDINDFISSVFIVKTDGDVGIGTTDPETPLHLHFTDSSEISASSINDNSARGFRITNAATTNSHGSVLFFESDSGTGKSAIAHQQNVADDDSSIMTFYTQSAGTLAEAMRIDSDGNVGIGTAAPNSLLHAKGGDLRLSNNKRIYFDDTNNYNYLYFNSGFLTLGYTVDAFKFDMNASSVKTIEMIYSSDFNIQGYTNKDILITTQGTGDVLISNGNVGIGTTTPFAALSVHSKSADTRPLFAVASTTPNGVTATTTAFIITADGNVGIGTTAPTEKLDVAGKIAINGTAQIYFPDQTDFLGTMYIGNSGGGASLSHTTGGQGQYNISIGEDTGDSITEGHNNTFIGMEAGRLNTTGWGNVFIGKEAGENNSSAAYNIAIGYRAGQSLTTRSYNTFIGFQAGKNSVTTDDSIFIGNDAGYNNITGDKNIYIGTEAGYNTTGDTNIFLGNQAGYNETGSDKLYIANSKDTSLIYGDFSTGNISIGGTAATSSNRFLVTGTGNIGIGTTGPNYKLEVYGTASTTKLRLPQVSEESTPTLSFGDGDTGFYESADDQLRISIGGDNKWAIYANWIAGQGGGGAGLQGAGASATAPTVIPHTSYATTGLGSAGANILSLIAGGTNGLNVISSGNVGIGTTSPMANLNVKNTSAVYSSVVSQTALLIHGNVDAATLGSGPAIRFAGTNVGGWDLAAIRAHFGSAASGYGGLAFYTGYNTITNKMVIEGNGNVGIGTTSPQAKLDVYGDPLGGGPDFSVYDGLYRYNIGYDARNLAGPYDNYFSIYKISSITHYNSAGSAGSQYFDSNGVTKMVIIGNTGNVGIGTTSPDYTLQVNGDIVSDADDTDDLGKDGLRWSNIWVHTEHVGDIEFANQFRMTEATSSRAALLTASSDEGAESQGQSLNYYDALSINNASSTPLLYLVENGNIGIATSSPTNILTIGQGQGNAIADGWDVYSSREYKTDIIYLEEQDYDEILEQIEGMDLARYKWKKDVEEENSRAVLSDTPSQSEGRDPQWQSLNPNLGVIVEDEGTPQEVLSKDGKSISLYDYTTFALAGVKALNEGLKVLNEFLTVKQDENGNLVEIDPLEGLRVRLAELGLFVDEDGVLIVEKIKAKAVETETLEVKAEEVGKTGITLYDRGTGQPYCFYIENGVSMTVAGQCAVAVTPVSNPIDSSPTEENSEEPTVEIDLTDSIAEEIVAQTDNPADSTESNLETSATEPVPESEPGPEPTSETTLEAEQTETTAAAAEPTEEASD